MQRNERGVSLIALVITIIVIIILAAIAFSSSTRTITEANKSNIINNISEVSSAFHTEAVTVKGKEAAKGNTKTDEQVYNYVAKGGKEEGDFLVISEVPEYTIISKNADIGIKLPKMQLESGTGKLVEVTYAVTKEGKVFIWPPYEDNGEYYITDKDTVETQMTTDIKVGNESLTIVIDQNDGSLLDADGTAPGNGSTGGTGNEGTGGAGSEGTGGNGGEETSVTIGSEINNIKVGDTIIYTPVAAKYTPDTSKTGYTGTQKELETNLDAKWRVLSINETAKTIKVTTEGVSNTGIYLKGETGYVKGPGELNTICEKLYSNTAKGITARSMTIEDLDETCGYDKTKYVIYGTKHAYYKSSDYVEGTTDGYTNFEHTAIYYKGYTEPRFYTYDEKGETKTVESENDYKVPTATSPVKVTSTYYTYNPSTLGTTNSSIVSGMLGNSVGWLASPCVYTNGMYAEFRVCHVNSNLVDSYTIFKSNGGVNSFSNGLRPLLDLSSELQIEAKSEGVWEIK